MKTIILLVPAIVAGAIRYPSEGPIPVRKDEEAQHLIDQNLAELFEEENAGDLDAGDGLDKEKVDDLKQIAADEGVDLGDATKKADIIAAIRKSRASKES